MHTSSINAARTVRCGIGYQWWRGQEGRARQQLLTGSSLLIWLVNVDLLSKQICSNLMLLVQLDVIYIYIYVYMEKLQVMNKYSTTIKEFVVFDMLGIPQSLFFLWPFNLRSQNSLNSYQLTTKLTSHFFPSYGKLRQWIRAIAIKVILVTLFGRLEL